MNLRFHWIRKEPIVAVNVHIHKVYRSFTDGLETVAVEGQTVGDCLKSLAAQYPDINRVLFATNGEFENRFCAIRTRSDFSSAFQEMRFDWENA